MIHVRSRLETVELRSKSGAREESLLQYITDTSDFVPLHPPRFCESALCDSWLAKALKDQARVD